MLLLIVVVYYVIITLIFRGGLLLFVDSYVGLFVVGMCASVGCCCLGFVCSMIVLSVGIIVI